MIRIVSATVVPATAMMDERVEVVIKTEREVRLICLDIEEIIAIENKGKK